MNESIRKDAVRYLLVGIAPYSALTCFILSWKENGTKCRPAKFEDSSLLISHCRHRLVPRCICHPLRKHCTDLRNTFLTLKLSG